MNPLLLIALPYAALILFIGGLLWRFGSGSQVSSQSSQILESRLLVWGTIPFHIGIAVVFLCHLIPLLAPGMWRTLVSNRVALLTIEIAGLAAGILCFVGLVVLFVRRIGSRKVRAGSTAADLLVLSILILQVALGVAVSVMHRWGTVWAVGTTVPYLRSLITFRPEPAFVAGVPKVMQWHLLGAWIVLAALPFTRLVHMLTLPLGYVRRPPQKVVWTTAR